MRAQGITRKEALEQLVNEDLEIVEKGDEKMKKLVKARGLSITKKRITKRKRRKKT